MCVGVGGGGSSVECDEKVDIDQIWSELHV